MRRAAIIGTWCLLIACCGGLFLASASKIRETAGRVQCRNNLRQIDLALQNYYDTNGNFPAGTVANPDLPPERRLSWLFELDPFVHARMDPTWNQHSHEAWDSDGNLALQRGRMPWYECPRGPPVTGVEPLGRTNYVGAAGIGADAAMLSKTDPRTGAFGYDRKITRDDISDGLSSSIMVVETLSENGPWVAGGPATVRALSPDSLPIVGRDGQFGWQHYGGVMAAFADGSVHFIRSSANPDALGALFTIAGNDFHDSPWDE